MSAVCEQIRREMGELFSCTEGEGQVRIRTPFLLPDGDVIDLYLQRADDVVTLSDLGETLRWLRMQTISQKRTGRQQALVQDVCQTHGVELFRGMLMLRIGPGESLAQAVIRLAEASVRVADLWFTFRSRMSQTVADEVEELLQERHVPYQRGERLPGRSGRAWTIDFHTRAPGRSSLVCVLATGSRGAARSVTDHVVATWYDLSHLRAGPEALHFVSLFDDTADVWSEEDFRLVGDLSEIARWSRPDEFGALIAAPAVG
ncbi:DUF1828 domain-containing protein [Myxococcota bacterium]|nr:DUF1828 domain-containing protein [Myxococcota bacterium]